MEEACCELMLVLTGSPEPTLPPAAGAAALLSEAEDPTIWSGVGVVS